jgi:hypothetical protein
LDFEESGGEALQPSSELVPAVIRGEVRRFRSPSLDLLRLLGRGSLYDETVLDAEFVGRTEPDALHSSDSLEEDDAFLSLGSEIWEYDVAEGKDEDFQAALRNSGMVMEFEALESGDELGVS